MSDESIDVEIKDKIAPSIKVKIGEIGKVADSTQSAIDRLNSRLKQLAGSSVGRLSKLLEKLNSLGSALAKLETGVNKASMAENKAAIAAARLTSAQNQAALSAKRLEISQVALAKAESQAAAAKDRAAMAALRLAQAQAKQDAAARAPIGKGIKEGLGMLGIVAGVAGTVALADSYTILQNKLNPVTETVREQVDLIGDLNKVANDTYAPIQDTAQAFSRFDRALRQTGRSQRDTLKITETVNKMLALSGAVANEAGAALLQLSQAFNKGKLDGDEFRTVMELMPTAADAIAKELGVTRGELLKLAPEGKITTEIMARAFEAAAKDVDASFGRTIPTITQAIVVAKNNIIELLGVVNNTTGIFTGTANAVMFLANNLDSLATIALVVGTNFAILHRLQIAAWFTKVTTGAKALWAVLAANPLVALASLIAVLIVNLDDLTEGFTRLVPKAREFWDSLWSSDQERRAKKFDEFMKKRADTEHEERFKRMTASQREWHEANAKAVEQMQQLAKWGYSYGEAVSWANRHTNAFKDNLLGMLAGLEGQSKYQRLLESMQKMSDKRFDIQKEKKEPKGRKDPEETRARWLARINAELDNELSRLYMIEDVRSAEQRMNRIEEQAITRKFTLNDFERWQLETKIGLLQDAQREQSAYDALYQQYQAPRKEYEATQRAIDRALEDGVVNVAEYERELRKLSLTEEKRLDPLWDLNRAYTQELDLVNRLSRDREIEAELYSVKNQLLEKGIELGDAAENQMRERFKDMRAMRELQATEDDILDRQIDKWRKFELTLKAFQNTRAQLTERQQAQEIYGMLPEELTRGTNIHFDKMLQDREDYYRQIDEMRKRDMISEQAAETMKLRAWQQEQNTKLGMAQEFFSAFEGMQRSNYEEMAAVGKAAAIANATISAYQAANSAYAAMAGIPGVGPALGAAAALAAMTSGMANVSAIMSQPTGFKTGGYTGNMGVNDVAGVVHGREFVFDAGATSRLGRANLEALRSGDTSGIANSSAPEITVPVNVAFVSSQQEAEEWLSSKDGQNVIVDAISKKARSINRILKGAE